MDATEFDMAELRRDAEAMIAWLESGSDRDRMQKESSPARSLARFVLAMTDPTRFDLTDAEVIVDEPWYDGFIIRNGQFRVRIDDGFSYELRNRGDLARLRLGLRAGGGA